MIFHMSKGEDMSVKDHFRCKGGNSYVTLGIVILLFSAWSAWAWGGDNHQRISRAALQLLPEREKEMLGPAADSLIEKYCLYPDWYRSALREENLEKIERYKPYVHLPLLQELGKWHKNMDSDSEICFYIAATLMHQAVIHLRGDDPLEAAQYMGSLVHFIEDNACPVHVVADKLLAELMPVPDELQPLRLHGAVEGPPFPIDVSGYEVSVLGTNVVEAAAAFYPRFLQIRRSGRAQSISIVQAIYRGDEHSANVGRARAAVPSG